MWKIYLSPPNITNICEGLTYGKRGAKFCHTKNCTKLRHPTSIPGCLFPSHAYLVLLVSHILHLFSLSNYKGSSEGTLQKLLDTHISIDNTANIRYSFYATPQHVLEDEINCQLFIPPTGPQFPSPNSPQLPPQSLPV